MTLPHSDLPPPFPAQEIQKNLLQEGNLRRFHLAYFELSMGSKKALETVTR